jgi:hypothetical protein
MLISLLLSFVFDGSFLLFILPLFKKTIGSTASSSRERGIERKKRS